MRVPIVNEDDNIIGYGERGQNKAGAIYRIVALWITNSKGEILLQQRSANKKHYANKWSFTSGSVEGDDSYEVTMEREMKEELGVSIPFSLGPKGIIDWDDGFSAFVQYFFAKADIDIKDLKLQEEEVAAVRWITKEDLLKELEEHPEHFTSKPEKWRRWLEESTPF